MIPYFHLPNVKAEQNPGLLKLNIYNIYKSTIKSDSPPEHRFITGSFCLGLFFNVYFNVAFLQETWEEAPSPTTIVAEEEDLA